MTPEALAAIAAAQQSARAKSRQAVADGVPYTGEQPGGGSDSDANPATGVREALEASADLPASDPVSTNPDDRVPDTAA
jgi:hypothetical protein